MKLIKFLIVIYLIVTPILHAQTNIQPGLYIRGDLDGYFFPYLDGGGELSLYYRFITDVFPGYIWEGVRTDIGISDHLDAERNKLKIYVDSSISKYFNINASASLVNYYTAGKRGFVNFESANVAVDTNAINKALKTDNISFEAEATPTFMLPLFNNLFDGTGLIIQAALTFKYAYVNNGKYFLDYELLLVREQNDISYKLDSMILFDLYPLSVGINYMLAYINNTKQLWHSIGAYAHFEYEFLSRFYTEVNLKIGQYISHPSYTGKLYFNMDAGLVFKII